MKTEDVQQGKKCSCVTCDDVYECLDKVAARWKTASFDLKGSNCRDFVRAALDACCLKYPINDHFVRVELRALTILGAGVFGPLVPLPEIEEGDM